LLLPGTFIIAPIAGACLGAPDAARRPAFIEQLSVWLKDYPNAKLNGAFGYLALLFSIPIELKQTMGNPIEPDRIPYSLT